MKFNNWFLPSHSTNGLVFTMKNHNVLILAVAFLFSGQAFGQRYDIRDFGARTDSTFLNTKAIQSAIDQCAGKGGGEVLVPAGTYYTGTIFLKSNVFLHLSAGGELQPGRLSGTHYSVGQKIWDHHAQRPVSGLHEIPDYCRRSGGSGYQLWC
jgi:hypothetical protein